MIRDRSTDLGLLQRGHPAAQHGAAVPADFKEQFSVVAGAAIFSGFHY